MTKPALEQRLAVMLGGRAAELLIFQQTSTGASNDLERATELARRMVTEFGMSKALGPVRYAGPAGSGYLGGQAATRNLSPDIENLIAKGANALIVLAWDSDAILPAVAKAEAEGIAVVGYDRLIEKESVFYLTFDNKEVGRMQARAVFAASFQ